MNEDNEPGDPHLSFCLASSSSSAFNGGAGADERGQRAQPRKAA